MVGALIQYDRCPCTKRERDMERHTGRRHLVKTEVGIGAMALKPTDPKDPGREVWKDSPSQPQREPALPGPPPGHGPVSSVPVWVTMALEGQKFWGGDGGGQHPSSSRGPQGEPWGRSCPPPGPSDGAHISDRHLALLCATKTYAGHSMVVTRHGVNSRTLDPSGHVPLG